MKINDGATAPALAWKSFGAVGGDPRQGGTPGRAPRAQPLGFGCFSTRGFGVSGRFARGSDGFVGRAAALPKEAGCLLRGWGKKNIRKNKKGIRSKSGGALLSPDLQEFLV